MAIKLKYGSIGITDHYVTWKGNINYVRDEQIESYIKEIKGLNNKYSGIIRVLAGLEIDTSTNNPNRKKLPFAKLNDLDYVLFEYVDEDDEFDDVMTLTEIIAIRKKLRCHVGLAHANVERLCDKYSAPGLATMLSDNNIFVDVCGSKRNPKGDSDVRLKIQGLGEEFKNEMRKQHVKFLPSSDTHDDSDNDKMADAQIALRVIEDYKLSLLEML
jgi:DNA polymerase (family 10)/histidinol-phosphatase (PHP family)